MTTYYVDGAVGNDANAGTSEGAGNAWATVDKAMNTVVAGDKVWVKASATYSETPNIDTAGTNTSPITFEGYTSTTGDNGKATISGTTNCLTTSVAANYYIFKNLIFSGASSHGISGATMDDVHWFNCEFNSNGGDGANVDQRNYFINCEFLNNTTAGLDAAQLYVFGCIFGGNGDNAITSGFGFNVLNSVFYGIPANKIAIDADTLCEYIIGNTIDCENNIGTVGIKGTGDVREVWIYNNIIYDCATGVDNAASAWHYGTFAGYNLMNSNTTDYANTYDTWGVQDVSGAPAFTNEAGDDYTLGASSAAIDAGMNPGGIT